MCGSRLRFTVCEELEEVVRQAILCRNWLPNSLLNSLPKIRICEGLSVWGRCIREDGGYRIELSDDLVYGHAWYAIVDVLMHELAHYLVWALHGDLEEGPHGPTFRRICVALGGTVKASENYPPLDASILLDDASLESQVSPVSLKIKKLLALSGSDNENEARLALCKARELMVKYGVDGGASDDLDPFVSVDIRPGAVRLPAEEAEIAWFLERFYGVICVQSKEVEVKTLVAQAVISVLGRRSQVKVALYVRDYIYRCVKSGWRLYHAMYGGGKRVFRDYVVGFVQGMAEALSRQEEDHGGWGLIKQEEAGLRDFAHRRFPRLRMGHSQGRRVDVRSRQAGFSAGKETRIHPGIGDDQLRMHPRRLTDGRQ